MSNNNGTRKISTIRVNHACHDLRVTEKQFRPWLQPFYKNWKKVQRIKYEYYEIIAESIEDRIKELEEQQESEVQQEIESQQQEAEVQQEIEPPVESTHDDGTTSSLTVTDELGEELDISPQEAKERLRLQIRNELPSQVVRRNQSIKILAVSAADEDSKDFEEIYTHRLTTNLNRGTSNLMAKICKSIDVLQSADNGDFLQSVGKNRNLQSSDLDAGMNLLLSKIRK